MFELGVVEASEGAEVASRPRAAMFGHEPRAGVQGSHFVKVEIRDVKTILAPRIAGELPRHVGGSQQRFIVENDGHAVARELNVELPGAGA